jgi:hypothetical protein
LPNVGAETVAAIDEEVRAALIGTGVADSLEPSPLISSELEPSCAPMIVREAGILSQPRRARKGAAPVLKAQ